MPVLLVPQSAASSPPVVNADITIDTATGIGTCNFIPLPFPAQRFLRNGISSAGKSLIYNYFAGVPAMDTLLVHWGPGLSMTDFAPYGSKSDTRTTTSSTSTVITSTGAGWTTNQWSGGNLWFTSGPAAGQSRAVSSNTSTTVTVSSAFSPAPTSGGGDTFYVDTRVWTSLDMVFKTWKPAIDGVTGRSLKIGLVMWNMPGAMNPTGTLNAGINSSQTSITLSSAINFGTAQVGGDASVGIQIDSEKMTVTGGAGTPTLTVIRGVDSSSTASHSNGATVRLYSASALKYGFPWAAARQWDDAPNHAVALANEIVARYGAANIKAFSYGQELKNISNRTNIFNLQVFADGLVQFGRSFRSYAANNGIEIWYPHLNYWSSSSTNTVRDQQMDTLVGNATLSAAITTTGQTSITTSTATGFPAAPSATTLSSGMTAGQTTMAINQHSGWPTTGPYVAIIDSEHVLVTPGVNETDTTTSATSTVATVTGANWTSSKWVNGTITYTSGPASGEVRTVTSSNATTITVGTAFNPAPTSGGGDTFFVQAGSYGTNTWTITRGYDGTTAASHSSGASVSRAYTIQIDHEYLQVVGGVGTTSSTVTRGYDSSTATTHTNGSSVYNCLLQDNDEIILNTLMDRLRSVYRPDGVDGTQYVSRMSYDTSVLDFSTSEPWRTGTGAPWSNVVLRLDMEYHVLRVLKDKLTSGNARYRGGGWSGQSRMSIESYIDVNQDQVGGWASDAQQGVADVVVAIYSALAGCTYHARWEPQGDKLNVSPTFAPTGDLEAWFRGQTDSDGADGTSFPHGQYFSDFSNAFPPGTALLATTTDNTNVVPIASATKVGLANIASTSQTISVASLNGFFQLPSVTLPGYSFTVVNVTSTPFRDTYSRTSTSSWGTADAGGTWTLPSSGLSAYNVTSNVGTMLMSATNQTRRAALFGVNVLNAAVTVQISTDKLAVGDSQQVIVTARQINTGTVPVDDTMYMLICTFGVDQSVKLQIHKRVAAAESALDSGGGQTTVSRETHAAAKVFNVKFQAAATGPTALAGKIWSGLIEPASWDITGTDSEATLQTGGGVGLRAFDGAATNVPVTASWDQLIGAAPTVVTSTGASNLAWTADGVGSVQNPSAAATGDPLGESGFFGG